MLEEAEQDLVVSLVERFPARAKLVSFTSNHISGTVLPLLLWLVSGGIAP